MAISKVFIGLLIVALTVGEFNLFFLKIELETAKYFVIFIFLCDFFCPRLRHEK